MAALPGLEPGHDGIKIRCLTNLAKGLLATVEGIEPSSPDRQSRIINHYKTRPNKFVVNAIGFEPKPAPLSKIHPLLQELQLSLLISAVLPQHHATTMLYLQV